jgi:hypothetical protein
MLDYIIHAWIERIVEHVRKVVELEGGNEYKEGRLEAKRSAEFIR